MKALKEKREKLNEVLDNLEKKIQKYQNESTKQNKNIKNGIKRIIDNIDNIGITKMNDIESRRILIKIIGMLIQEQDKEFILEVLIKIDKYIRQLQEMRLEPIFK